MVAVLASDYGSGIFLLLLLVDAVCAVFTSLSAGPPPGTYVVWRVLVVSMHSALCSLLLFSSPDACILAGFDQKDSCTVHPCPCLLVC